MVYTDLTESNLSVVQFRRLSLDQEQDVSVVQRCILSPTTPLLCLSQWKSPTTDSPKPKEKRKKGKPSQYSAATMKPPQQMFKPNTNKKTVKKETPKKVPYAYPTGECRPVYEKHKLTVSDRRSPVQALSYSRDSDFIAVGLADYSAVVLKLPGGSKSVPLTGHKGPLTSVKWSALSSQVITTAGDRTCKMWDVTSGSMIIDLKYRDGNTKNSCLIGTKRLAYASPLGSRKLTPGLRPGVRADRQGTCQRYKFYILQLSNFSDLPTPHSTTRFRYVKGLKRSCL
eukprot:sb/3467809/